MHPGTALFWVVTQPVVATSYHYLLHNNPLESVLIYFAAEAWYHTHIFNNIQEQHMNVSNEILLTSRKPCTSFDPHWLQTSVYVPKYTRPYVQSLSSGLQGLLLLIGFTVSSVQVGCLGIQGNWCINLGSFVGRGSDTAR